MSLNLSGPFAATGNADGVEAAAEPGYWSINHTPAAATQATITKAAVAGTRHVCKTITATIACAGTAQTPLAVYLRDGATGVGTILWSAKVSAPANTSQILQITGLSVVGSVNTAMTLEFAAAGVAASEATVSLSGFDVTGI